MTYGWSRFSAVDVTRLFPQQTFGLLSKRKNLNDCQSFVDILAGICEAPPRSARFTF